LLAWAGRELEHHPAVRFALGELQEAPHTQTIAEVSGRVGLSQKSFIDHFREEVGLTPKLFCRVRRFQRAIQSIAQGRTVEWAGVAADCGYFDQAHFIHDFKAFSGLSPTAYLRRRTEHLNHVPIDS
jgi:AraC-like DNA-binding protein